MALDTHEGVDQGLVKVQGAPIKQVFAQGYILGERVQRPPQFQPLTDFRPASEAARADAIAGIPPNGTQAGRFDPLLGPFSDPVLAQSAWAQSLEFLRDIKSATIGTTNLTKAWIAYWLNRNAHATSTHMTLFSTSPGTASKSSQMIWRARRVLNCLSHVLAILYELDDQTRDLFWQTLYSDIVKLAVPSDTLLAKLTERFDPLSPRASWLRAVALLGVEVAFPELLRPEWSQRSVNIIKNAMQSDGMIRGGSVIGTLSAATELSMLTSIAATGPLLNASKTALASLRRQDGTLVTFGAGSPHYNMLLKAVLGQQPVKPVSLLLASGIARAQAHQTVVWMRSAQPDNSCGASCEIEAKGHILLTNIARDVSGLALKSPAQIINSGCKRRDEPDCIILETDATVRLSGQIYHSLRHIKLAADGSRIEGQDDLRPEFSQPASSAQHTPVISLHFVLPQTSTCHLSKDKRSVLIVTSPQQMWRFRCEAMDIALEIGSEQQGRNSSLFRHAVMVCRSVDAPRQGEFRANWQFVLEESE
jgi:hypothetical protein